MSGSERRRSRGGGGGRDPAPRRTPDRARAQRPAQRDRRRTGAAQAGEPPADPLLQGARRLPPDQRPHRRRARPRAWSARAPATTARAWRGAVPGWASTAGSTCPATPRGRSGSASSRSARAGSTSSSRAARTTSPGAAALADSERTGAVYVPPFDDVRTIAGQGTVAVELMARPRLPVAHGDRAARRRRPRRRLAVWLRERHPQVRIVGVEPAGRGEHDGRARRRRTGAAARGRHVRRRRGRRPGRRPDLPAGARPGRRGRHGRRRRGVHRDARPLPGRGDHRRARRGAGQRRRPRAGRHLPGRQRASRASSPAATTT